MSALRLAGLALVAGTLLVACGGGQSQGGASSAAGTASAAKPKSGEASAEQVAEEARDGIRCPAKVKSAERAAGAPIDDIQGVRPGLTFDEAKNLVLCSNELLVAHDDTARGFNIKTYGQTIRQGFAAQYAEPRVVKSSKQIMQEMQDDMIARSGNAVREDLKAGQSKWFVWSMGMPGEERVIGAARAERFDADRNPTMASVEQALLKKYGEPTRRQMGGTTLNLSWVHDDRGRPVGETSPLYNSCTVVNSPDGGSNFSPDCGITVGAQIVAKRDNEQLAERLEVGVVDQASGYAAITNTEAALEAMEVQKRASEVQDAAKNADAPAL